MSNAGETELARCGQAEQEAREVPKTGGHFSDQQNLGEF